MKRESYYIMLGIQNPVLKVFLAILFGVVVVVPSRPASHSPSPLSSVDFFCGLLRARSPSQQFPVPREGNGPRYITMPDSPAAPLPCPSLLRCRLPSRTRRRSRIMDFPLELEREIFELAAWSSSKHDQLSLMLVSRKTWKWYEFIALL